MIMEGKLINRKAQESDRDQVLELLNLVFGGQQKTAFVRDKEFWSWKFNDNPFGVSIVDIVEDNGNIIAAANLWPWEFNLRGQTIKALQPCDSAVHPDYQGRGLFKSTRISGVQYAIENNYDLIFNFPNANSLPTYQSLGWNYLGKIGWWVKILKPVSLLKNKFVESDTVPFDLEGRYAINPELLDEVAEESISFDGFIKTNRPKGFHKWRYVDKPNRTYGMVVDERGRKRGAAIFTLNQHGKGKEMVIVDYIGYEKSVIPLINTLIGIAKSFDVNYIAIMHNSRIFEESLWKKGFFKKKLKNIVTLPLNINLENKAHKISSFSMFAGMHDSI